MRIDPAKKLQEYRKRNKPPVIRNFFGNLMVQILFIIGTAAIAYLSKDFMVVWYETVIETIK